MYHNVTSDNVIHPNSKRGGLIERKRGGGGGEYWALTVSRVFIFSRFYENYRNISLYQHHTSTMLPDEITRFVAAERTEKQVLPQVLLEQQVSLEQQVLRCKWKTFATRLLTVVSLLAWDPISHKGAWSQASVLFGGQFSSVF